MRGGWLGGGCVFGRLLLFQDWEKDGLKEGGKRKGEPFTPPPVLLTIHTTACPPIPRIQDASISKRAPPGPTDSIKPLGARKSPSCGRKGLLAFCSRAPPPHVHVLLEGGQICIPHHPCEGLELWGNAKPPERDPGGWVAWGGGRNGASPEIPCVSGAAP